MKKYMRYSQDEKYEIIRLVDGSDLSANRTLQELKIHKQTYYKWYSRYLEGGYDGLASKAKGRRQTWNKIPELQKRKVVEEALEHETFSSRELAVHILDKHKWYISESSVYRILKERGLITAPAHILMAAGNEFTKKTTRVNEMWQTDFTYFKVFRWGWYYLSTVIDDKSRYIIAWDLCDNMTTEDVKPTINKALQFAGLTKENAPRLLSDNGPCYVSDELKAFLHKKGMDPIHGKPFHPQTQGKIERYHRSLKNVIKLENYYSPEELIKRITEFVNYYNNERYHESLNNLTPADVYFGREEKILKERIRIRKMTIMERRKNYFLMKNSLN